MTEQHNIPTPPHLPGLAWRPLQPTDQDAIMTLLAACQAADGGQALLAANAYIREGVAGTTTGAFDRAGRLVACAAVRYEQTEQEACANIVGQVHPDQREHGI